MLFNNKHDNFVSNRYITHSFNSITLLVLFCICLMGGISSATAGQQTETHNISSPPNVAVSIRPLHALVSAVMVGVGEPSLIVQGSGSAHGYQLRPRDAQNLNKANIVFWAGPGIESFLQKSLKTLGNKADIIALSTAPGIALLPMREGGNFETHDHYHEAGEHEHGQQHFHDHGHGDNENEQNSRLDDAMHADLHFWLDPENAKAAVQQIANTLSLKDPARADIYQKNAADYQRQLDMLEEQINKELSPLRGQPYIVFHDAYQYFEHRFEIPAIGSITVNPEHTPGAKRVVEIRQKIKNLSRGSDKQNSLSPQSHVCIFSEPQFEPRLVQVLVEGTNAKTGVLDPLGSNLAEGPQQYIMLMQNLANNLKSCLTAH